MSDPSDEHESLLIVDCVHDSVAPDSDAVVVAPGELAAAGRSRIEGESVDRLTYALADRPVKTPKLPRSASRESNLVFACYYRTSAHGTALSRSSRACSAARLSSR
jgi:hypothetical protein